MKSYMRLYVTIILLLAISAPARADTVYLKNGDRISGIVLYTSNSGTLHFRTSFNQDIQLPKSTIKSIDYDNVPVVYQTVLIGYNEPGTKNISVASTESEKDPVPAQEEKTPKPEESPAGFLHTKWSGRTNLGASLQTGNSEKNAINADAMVKAKWLDKHRVIVEAEYNRKKDDGNITEDNKSIEGVYDYFFNKKWFLNSTLGFEQDDINRIDLRTIVGLGLGYQVFERDDLNLKFILGSSYLHTDFENGNSEDSAAIRWNADYDQKFFEGLIQIFHDHDLIVPADDTDDFLLDTKTGVRVPLKMGLVATAQIDFDWDNKPEPGITEDDTKYSLKLGYEW